MDDRALLKQFVTRRDEQAFAELVRRHIDLVYAAARRQLRDPAAVEDVTQSVFVLLATKAAKIRDSEALAGWLLVATRCVVLNTIRTDSRRRKHEGRAVQMKAQSQPDGQQQWESIGPLLDEAVAGLKIEDRNAITLRYFKGQSVSDVAAALGVSTDAAQKRVLRAVERLRDFFARRGVLTSSDALTSALAVNVLAQAPVQLTAQIAASALSAGSTTGASLGMSKAAAILVATTKTKAALAVTAALIVASTMAPIVHHLTRSTVSAQLNAAPAAPAASSQPAADGWKARINEVYGLADGQVFKRVPPPFIPERDNAFGGVNLGGNRRAGARGPQMSADALVFSFNGTDAHWTRAMRDTMDVAEVLKTIVNIWPQDTDIDRALLASKVPGDWVVRDGVKPADCLVPLTSSIADVIGPGTLLNNEVMEREVVVVRGTLKFTEPLKEKDGFPTVYLFRGAVRPATAFSMSAGQTPTEMLQLVGELLGRPMIVEADLTSGKAAAVAMHQLADWRRAINVPNAALVDEILANLSKQTSLEFKRERRAVPTWRLVKQDL